MRAWSEGPGLKKAGSISIAPQEFIRAHRAAIVNLREVKEFDQRDGAWLVMSDGARVHVSREPDGIRASELRRDNTLESDDTFSVLLDTFLDHRNASVFRVNPRGTRFDALIRNESRVMSTDWDEQWTAAAVLTETGWSVEMAIPFKILRFRNGPAQTWGLNFERVIKRRNELAYWSG